MRKVIDFAKVYETAEAAEVLRVSPRTIQQLCRMKRICAAKIGKVQDVLIELHVAGEGTKQGFTPEEALETFTADYVGRFKNIRICGVMGMASNTDDQNRVREDFKAIKACFEKFRETVFAGHDEFREISMGMSGDYLIAIEEGSTIVRVGSAIFGPRQY